MGLLERALRDTFDAQVGRTPAVEDPAGRAIQRANRIRQRRTSMAVLTAAACVALISAGIAQLSPRPATLPLTAPGTVHIDILGPLPLAVLDGDRLVRKDRSSVPLGTPTARRAWQVDDGWIVETAATQGTGAALWFLPPSGEGPTLLVEGGQVALAADGLSVAWGGQDRVSVATRTGGTLSDKIETTGTGSLLPVAFLGDGVLLGGSVDGAPSNGDESQGDESSRYQSSIRYDMWFPQRGRYQPGPLSSDQLFATTQDGSRGYAVTPGMCVVLLVPDGLTREESACDVVGTDSVSTNVDQIVPSPDGRWLALNFIGRIELYDVATFWSLAAPAETWLVSGSNLTWVDDGSFVISTGTMLVQYAVDQAEPAAMYALGPQPGGDPWIVPIPALR